VTGVATLFLGPDTAVAALDGVIVAVGADAREWRGTARDVVELGPDDQLVPGFRDGHVHPLWAGRALLGPPIAGSASVDELLERLRAYAVTRSPDRWVVGAGYDPSLLPAGLGDAATLDAVVPDRPVLLWATDLHSAWANSMALARAGISAATPDPPRGRFVRRGDGSPSGALVEEAATIVAARAPALSQEETSDGLRVALTRMAANGLVWAQEAAVTTTDVAVYTGLAAGGELTCRTNLALRAEPTAWRGQRPEFVATRDQLAASDSPDALAARTVKFFADGIIEAGTAALLEPYSDDPGCCGIANWPPDELAAAVAAFDADGFQVHIHAIGDAGIRTALDAIEHAVTVNGRRDRRPVIAHTQLVDHADLPRFAPLGVIANFEPLWAQRDPIMTELTEPRLGPTRSAQQYPMGSLTRLGTRLSFGSDWPVSSVRPLDGLAVATTRQTHAGEPPGGWLAEETLTRDAAIAAYTTGVAYQAFEEADAGAIAVGQRADLCLLGAPVDAVVPREIPEIPVLGTWVGGTEVFRA
jgi:predicted amidohydrolase YtcJ